MGTATRSTGPQRAAVYVRISEDQTGAGLGVGRQEADCRALCEYQGWVVVEVYCDNDRSAYQRRKPRPAYGKMLADLAAGKIDVVVAWHPDRLHRQLRELVPFIDLVNDHGVTVQTVKSGIYDLTTPSGRMQAQIAGAVAEHESSHKSERIKRKLQENAASGKHHGGSRPYGWGREVEIDESGRAIVKEDPAEAEIIRWATKQALAGNSMKGIARELNERGVLTATGRQWRAVTVRSTLLRERNAGIRTYTSADGTKEEVGPGLWDAIVDVDDFRQLQAMLLNPSRVTNPGKSGKVHLLSIHAKCGVCGGRIVVAKGKMYKGVAKTVYRCKEGHVVRDQELLDRFVSKLVIARLEKMDVRDLMVESRRRTKMARTVRAQIQEIEERLQDAAGAFAAGNITMAQLTTINSSLRPRLEELRTKSVSPARDRVIGELVEADEPKNVWAKLSDERKRTVVSLLVDVTVNRSKPGGIFNPNDIGIVWRT
jgi:DNA invertase Pin-like site-specific DNA recombinase